MPARHPEHGHDDEDGDELRQHADAHQPVRPARRHVAADPKRIDAQQQNAEYNPDGNGDENLAGDHHQLPVLGIEIQGSSGAFAPPFCRSSTEMPSGERTNAMWPSRGGRLMTTPPSF